MKSISLQDLARLQFQNQFTVPGTEVLNDPDKLYFITAIEATGPWTISIKSENQDEKFRTFTRTGKGPEQFFLPVCVDEATFTGVSEVSGFYLKTNRY
ncbi:hypothetical protein BES34_014295 [Leptospira inadai serovar Lyme]|uniref:Uncharacterized protein n=2 Tax=Leptospira inadai TaxID=29506 RepID=A0ABX4YGS2_9LEPT|nr:hypothetical protein BES34_014295 [Leptospira inadai serovar Lyme]